MSKEPTDDGLVSFESLMEIEVAAIARRTRAPVQSCRDHVILLYLNRGDVRALVHFLLEEKHVPGWPVRWLLGNMLGAGDKRISLPNDLKKAIPYRLEMKGPKKGRRVREIEIRNVMIADAFHRFMVDDSMTYDQALNRTEQRVREAGWRIGRETIRNAYDDHYGKRSRE